MKLAATGSVSFGSVKQPSFWEHCPVAPAGEQAGDGNVFDEVHGSRAPRFFSSVNVVMGPQHFPVKFEIKAATLKEALEQAHIQGPLAGKAFEEEIETQRARARILGAGQMESLAATKQ